MKAFTKIVLITLATAGFSQAAVTITCKNFNTLAVGIPVLDGSGNALTAGNRSWSIGFYAPGFNFATATAADLKSATNFTQFGVSSTTFGLNGLFNASIVASLPANDATYTGKTIYTVVGNNTTLATSTEFAVFTSGATFPVVDAGGTGIGASTTVLAANVVFGKALVAPVTQPNGSSTFPQGVEVGATNTLIPEPSAALLGALGALGLLRRRRI